MSHQPAKKQWELTGQHVLIAVISFFLILILVNGAFIFAAVGSFRGEDVKQSYRQGLNYNQTIEDRRKQANLGWQASVEVRDAKAASVGKDTPRELIVRVTDVQGRLVPDVRVEGRLRHPIDTALDMPLSFTNGLPASASFLAPSGRWTLEADAVRGADRFTLHKSIVLE